MKIKRKYFNKGYYLGLMALAEELKEKKIPYVEVSWVETTGEDGDLVYPHFMRLQYKVEEVFNSNMIKELSWYKPNLRNIGRKELRDRAMEWSPLSRKLRRYIAPLRILDDNLFFETLKQRLEPMGIEFMAERETYERYGHKRKVLIKR